MKRGLWLIFVISVTVPPGIARGDADDLNQAKATFQVAKAMYDARRFKEAVVELKKAYDLSPRTPLLRYIADCYARTAQHEQAVEYYTRYVNRSPEGPQRDAAQKALDQQKQQLASQRERANAGKKIPVALMPTGMDDENPNEQAPAPGANLASTTIAPPSDDGRAMKIAKWSTAAVGLVGLAMGVTFNRLAASKADELREDIKSECPPGVVSCAGNPKLNTPVVSYSLEHYHMQESMDSHNKAAVASFIIGGASAATSIVLFIVDSLRDDRRAAAAAARRVTVAPVIDGQNVGFSGQVRF